MRCDFLRRFEPVFGQIKPDIFADGQRIEQRAGLEHQRHAGIWRRFPAIAMDSPLMRISPASGASRPMRCLSRTLLPLPLGPMMTKISPGLDLEINALEHFLAVETLAQPAHLQADAGIWLSGWFVMISTECA